jgi:PAS domain S-box-containing protein
MKTRPSPAVSQSARIRILHVDDDPDFTDMTTTFLKREEDRFSIETATSASEGLNCLADGQFDCIVSDYDMPDRNGIDFLEAVRHKHPDLPFILFTGKGSEEVASKAITAGVTDYLQKEVGSDQYAILANRIRNAVERVRTEHERQRQLRAIETAQEGISILDEDGHYRYVNEAFAELHGYDPREMIGEHWELIYPSDDIPRVRNEILPEVEAVGYWRGETTSLRTDDTTVDVDHTLAMTDRGELVSPCETSPPRRNVKESSSVLSPDWRRCSRTRRT